MFITGISDESGKPIEDQIRAHRELGWNTLEVRGVQIGNHPPANLHDLSEEDFSVTERLVKDAGMDVCCFASMVANGKRELLDPFEITLDQAKRAITRMKRLGTRLIRIMSFGICQGSEDQHPQERFRRLRILVKMFRDEGLVPLHENCGNYGGLGSSYTMELLHEVPGIGIVFDTGNPVFSDDRSKPKPWPKQSAWEFYLVIRDRIDHVHIKDGVWNPKDEKTDFCFPGDGDGDVVQIVEDLVRTGYDGGFSIEPHMGGSFAAPISSWPENLLYNTYIEYGKRFRRILARASAAGHLAT